MTMMGGGRLIGTHHHPISPPAQVERTRTPGDIIMLFSKIHITRRRRQPILFSFVVMMLMNETLHASNSSKHNFRFLKTGPNAQGKTHFAWDANITAQNRARRAVSPEQARALYDRTIGHIPSGAPPITPWSNSPVDVK